MPAAALREMRLRADDPGPDVHVAYMIDDTIYYLPLNETLRVRIVLMCASNEGCTRLDYGSWHAEVRIQIVAAL